MTASACVLLLVLVSADTTTSSHLISDNRTDQRCLVEMCIYLCVSTVTPHSCQPRDWLGDNRHLLRLMVIPRDWLGDNHPLLRLMVVPRDCLGDNRHLLYLIFIPHDWLGDNRHLLHLMVDSHADWLQLVVIQCHCLPGSCQRRHIFVFMMLIVLCLSFLCCKYLLAHQQMFSFLLHLGSMTMCVV